MELKLDNVRKEYQKGVAALKDFHTTLTPGIYGLLGPNGAGKSTMLNIITNNMKPTKGKVFWNNQDIQGMGREYRKVLGYMPQQQGLYEEFSAYRFLWYMAALKGLKRKEAKEQISQLFIRVGLEKEMYKRVGGFSGGMKQRLLIAQALLGNPKLLILDEPTAGLDPNERIRLRNFISEIAGDKIVIFATHVVSDIEFIAKEVLLINHGELVQKGKVSELLSMVEGKVFEVEVDDKAVEELKSQYRVSNVYRVDEQCVVRILSDVKPDRERVREVMPNLEDLYLYMTT